MHPVQGRHFEGGRTIAVTQAPIQRFSDPQARHRETENAARTIPARRFASFGVFCELFSG
jgi:hypothetical protein